MTIRSYLTSSKISDINAQTNKQGSILLERSCPRPAGDCALHSNPAGGDTTVTGYYSVFVEYHLMLLF